MDFFDIYIVSLMSCVISITTFVIISYFVGKDRDLPPKKYIEINGVIYLLYFDNRTKLFYYVKDNERHYLDS